MKRGIVKLMMAGVAVWIASAAGASSAEMSSCPLEELEPMLCADIDKLAARLKKDGITDSLEKSICERIGKIFDAKRQLACYRRLSDAVLSIRFEDVAEFPLEEWPLLMDKADIDEERARLKYVHSRVVDIVSKTIKRSMLMTRMPAEEILNQMFGLFEKMERERRRLNAQDVAEFVHVMDMTEREFDSVSVHHVLQPNVEKCLRERFEKIVGRPLRTCDEVRNAHIRKYEGYDERARRKEILKKMELMSRLREDYRKKMNLPPDARIPEPGTGSWRRLTGKKPGKVVLPPSET